MTNLQHFSEDIRKEFSVDSNGKVTASQRAIARLCGVQHTTIQRLLAKVAKAKQQGSTISLPKSLETLARQSFDGGAFLSDIGASSVIEYYAFDAKGRCTDQAKTVYRAFASVGFRAWVQGEIGWKPGTHSPQWQQTRLEGKGARHTLTDAVDAYIRRHPELSERSVKFMYPNMSNAAYCKTHGMKAHQIVAALGCDKANLRDSLAEDQLRVLRSIEDIASRLIDARDLNPVDAVKEAVDRALAGGLFVGVIQKQIESQSL